MRALRFKQADRYQELVARLELLHMAPSMKTSGSIDSELRPARITLTQPLSCVGSMVDFLRGRTDWVIR